MLECLPGEIGAEKQWLQVADQGEESARRMRGMMTYGLIAICPYASGSVVLVQGSPDANFLSSNELEAKSFPGSRQRENQSVTWRFCSQK